MNVDHFFSIGSAHQSQGRPCEDYALSGQLSLGTFFGAVADGCSGVSANTDVGARALAWAFQTTLENSDLSADQLFTNSFQDRLVQKFISFQFGNVPQDTFATLIGFVATQDSVQILAHGDGAVALRYRDGRMALIELEWLNSMPFYLAYHASAIALEEFLHPYRDTSVLPFQERTTYFTDDAGGLTVTGTELRKLPVQELLGGHRLTFNPMVQGIECVAVMTDGYAQVGSTPVAAVAREVLSYKNVQGDFVKRRMLRALKDFHKAGATPRDDIGVATVWLDPLTTI